jgi:hypothetical protein
MDHPPLYICSYPSPKAFASSVVDGEYARRYQNHSLSIALKKNFLHHGFFILLLRRYGSLPH